MSAAYPAFRRPARWRRAVVSKSWTAAVESLLRAMFNTLTAPQSISGSSVPGAWRPGRLGEVATSPRRAVAVKDITPRTPYVALDDLASRTLSVTRWGTADAVASGKSRFRRGEILFGKLRPYFHKVGIAPFDGVCSTDILVIAPKTPAWFGFVLGHVSSEPFVKHTTSFSYGTKMPRTNWTDMANYEVLVPPVEIAAEFTGRIQPLVDRLIALVHESAGLAKLRDALLPQLMSGTLQLNGGRDARRDTAAASA